MSLHAQVEATAVTRNRNTSVVFDIAETVPQEAPVSIWRPSAEMDPDAVSGCQRRASGIWTLKPLNSIGGATSETSAYQDGIVRASQLQLATGWVEVTRHRAITELTGVVAAGPVAATGNHYLTKRVAGNSTWNQSVAAANPAINSPNYPMDRVLQKPGDGFDPDTGYLLNVILRGAALTTVDFLFGFEFGGPVIGTGTTTGYGWFYLAFGGDGQAFLYERIGGTWVEVNKYRWGSPRDRGMLGLWVQILPHAPRFLEILSYSAYTEPGLISVLTRIARVALAVDRGDSGATGSLLHIVNNRGRDVAYQGQVLRSVTGRGGIAFDLRRDLLAEVQINRLIYPASGTITDGAFTLPYGYGTSKIVRPVPYVYHFQRDIGNTGSILTTAAVTVQDYQGGALAAANENITWRGNTTQVTGSIPVGGLNRMRAVVTLGNVESSPRTHTPSLTGYAVFREGSNGTHAPGEKAGGKLVAFSMTGPGFETEQETANLRIQDEKNELSFLRARGKASVRVQTRYDATNPNKVVILHEGYTGRVTSTLMGKEGERYPSPGWHFLDIDSLGKWDRFSNRFFYQRMPFIIEDGFPFSPKTTTKRPCKVTDVVRYCLSLEGFDDDQLDVFDEEVRLFSGDRHVVDQVSVPPGTHILEYAAQIARDYLNAYLIWEPNAKKSGASKQGVWRLMRPPTGSERPVWRFVTTPPTGTGTKLHHLPEAYGPPDPVLGANISRIYGGDEHPFKSYVIPPEGNVLTVSGAAVPSGKGPARQLRVTIRNPTSWNSPTHTIADDTDLDYLGRIVPVEYVDPYLGAGLEPALAMAVVRFIARRVFNLACRGQKWVEFVSTMNTVNAAALEPTMFTNPNTPRRPIRQGDVVTIDGVRYLMHSVQPVWEKDVVQLAHYEAMLYRPEITLR